MPLSEIRKINNSTAALSTNVIDTSLFATDVLYGFRLFKELLDQCSRHANYFIDITFERSESNIELIKLGDINLRIMFIKFERNQYKSVTEVVSDLRRIIELCYDDFGLFTPFSKHAEVLELVMQQKLKLFPRFIQDFCSLEETNLIQNREYLNARIDNGGRRQRYTETTWTPLMLQSDYREKLLAGIISQQRNESRRRETEITEKKLAIFLDSNTYINAKAIIKNCWQLPCIGSLIYMLRYELLLQEFNYAHFELSAFCMERSRLYQRIISSLLMTPSARTRSKEPLSYDEWSDQLKKCVSSWFRSYKYALNRGSNTSIFSSDAAKQKVLKKYGVNGELFDILGEDDPLEEKDFPDLNIFEKLAILNALCESALFRDATLCSVLSKVPMLDRQDVFLGELNNKCETYHIFPQFESTAVRVYKITYEHKSKALTRDFDIQPPNVNKQFEVVAWDLNSMEDLIKNLSSMKTTSKKATSKSLNDLVENMLGVYDEYNGRKDTFEKEGRIGLIAAMQDSTRVTPL